MDTGLKKVATVQFLFPTLLLKHFEGPDVITGDLSIIENRGLRKLFQKGPNFRERNSINFTKAREEIVIGLNRYVDTWSSRKGKVSDAFNEWRVKILEQVDKKIGELRKGPLKTWRKTSLVLKDPKNVAELEILKQHFVIVPIDKASNNIGIVCKKYMIENILKEIRTDTYEELGDTQTIIEEQTKNYIAAGWCITPENQKLPNIYATVKMHKSPVKFRYIIAAKECVSKPIAKELTKVLKLVLHVLRNYCEKIKRYTGVNRMWITESTCDILADIEQLNTKQKAKSIQTFDFSTLYTMINQQDLKEKLKWAVDKAFAGGTNQWIRVQKDQAKFDKANKKSSGKLYSKGDVHGMIDIIVDNAVFMFGDKTFRQTIGLPMGTDPAPFMANLYLFYYEFTYMNEMTSTDYTSARRYYGHTRRFIDDLATLNNQDHLKDNWMKIYPKELILNEENLNPTMASFLDLHIEVVDSMFKTKIYDKRDDFKFEIVNYPDINGNIPEGPAYGVYIGQMVRTARNTTMVDEFINRCKMTVKKLENKGYNIRRLFNVAKKCIARHPDEFLKYGKETSTIIKRIFPEF